VRVPLVPPAAPHYFGTDQIGRDTLSRHLEPRTAQMQPISCPAYSLRRPAWSRSAAAAAHIPGLLDRDECGHNPAMTMAAGKLSEHSSSEPPGDTAHCMEGRNDVR
jgi:hypothetical protein